jgi:hypothetical protein
MTEKFKWCPVPFQAQMEVYVRIANGQIVGRIEPCRFGYEAITEEFSDVFINPSSAKAYIESLFSKD